MWRLDPSPVHSDRDTVTVPSKIVSAFVTSSSNVGGMTVVARVTGSASGTSKRRIRERSNFITGYLVIDSEKRDGRRKRDNVRLFTMKIYGSRSNTSTSATPDVPSTP